MEEDFVTKFKKCPNCHDHGLEFLDGHSYCVLCNYSPAFEEPGDMTNMIWAVNYLKNLERGDQTETLAGAEEATLQQAVML